MNTEASVLAALNLIIARQTPESLESYLCRRGTFLSVDMQKTFDTFQETVEKYLEAQSIVKEDVLTRVDGALSKANGERVKLPGLVASIFYSIGGNPSDSNLKEKLEYIESLILKQCSENACEARYYRVVRGKNAGIVAWENRHDLH